MFMVAADTMSEYLYAYQVKIPMNVYFQNEFMCRQTYISRLERLYVATSRHSFVCALSQEICQQVRCFRCLCNIAYVRIILHLFVASSIFLCNVCDTQYEFLEGSPHSPEGSVGVVTQICVQDLLVSNLHANMYTYVCTYVRI